MIVKIKVEPYDSYSTSLKDKILGRLYRNDCSKLYNYGLAWQIMVKRAREASSFGRDSYCELRYEDLIVRPMDTLRSVLAFCELEWYDSFARNIPVISNENLKWKKELSQAEKVELEESTADTRKALNYI
jgi:hypothetical protein